MSCESFGDIRLDIGRFLQGQMSVNHFKMDVTPLLSVLEVWNVKLAYRKSCLVNLLMILDDLGHLLQGQRRVYHFYIAFSPLLSVLEVWNV